MIEKYADDELRRSAARGDSKAVRNLLRAGNDPGDMDNAALRRALLHGHPKIVKLLLGAGADISEHTAEFLKLAAENKDARSLKMLLRATKATVPQDILDKTLHAAITARNVEAVPVLIATGADPRAGDMAAMLAASAGSVRILEILRQHGISFDHPEGLILFNAVVANHLDAARYITASGVDVNARNHLVTTLAVVSGEAEMLEVLLDAGGTLPHPSFITDAADSDSVETLLVLIRHGCEFDAHADLIALSAARHDALRVLKYVLQYSQVTQNTLNLALPVAVDKASESVVNLLLQHGADASAKTSDALLRAVKSQKIAIARKLMNAGAQAQDLDASAFVITTKAENWPFLAELLQRCLPVTGVVLATDDAAKFFRNIAPAAFTQDAASQLLTRSIRKERNEFVKINGGTAAKKSGDEAVFISAWVTTFLKIQGGRT